MLLYFWLPWNGRFCLSSGRLSLLTNSKPHSTTSNYCHAGSNRNNLLNSVSISVFATLPCDAPVIAADAGPMSWILASDALLWMSGVNAVVELEKATTVRLVGPKGHLASRSPRILMGDLATRLVRMGIDRGWMSLSGFLIFERALPRKLRWEACSRLQILVSLRFGLIGQCLQRMEVLDGCEVNWVVAWSQIIDREVIWWPKNSPLLWVRWLTMYIITKASFGFW
jgi:hypothetical protein